MARTFKALNKICARGLNSGGATSAWYSFGSNQYQDLKFVFSYDSDFLFLYGSF
jgi:hypothetical protein